MTISMSIKNMQKRAYLRVSMVTSLELKVKYVLKVNTGTKS